jgi:hypothetical protein
MAGTWASPPTTGALGTASFGQRLPSISASFGVTLKPSTARCMASMVACRMFS